MKKLALLAGAFALIMSSCTQDLPVPSEGDNLQDVIFTASTELKYDIFDCENANPDYALLTFTVDHDDDVNTDEIPYPGVGQVITTPVFYVNDVMYTQAIKLPAEKSYTLVDMRLFATGAGDNVDPSLVVDDNPATPTNDLLVNAVPYTGSHYANLITAPVPVQINVSPFAKTEVPISILCYDETEYEEFGFTWFRIEENNVRTKYFFGDFCTKFFEDYLDAELYEDIHVLVDMPAIMKLRLHKLNLEYSGDTTSIFVDEFTNEGTYADGEPLRVAYPDMEADDDIFRLDVFIYVKIGDGFGYKKFVEWFWNDNEEEMYTSLDDLNTATNSFNSGGVEGDGVYDFILGNCNVAGADIIFAPYMNLPEPGTPGIDMTLEFPGTASYFNATLTGIGAGFDLANGTVEAYCFDLGHTISTGVTLTDIDIYSSLYPASLPIYMQNENWGAVNWLANNYTSFEGWTWQELQLALWLIEVNDFNSYSGGDAHGLSGNATRINNMVASALLNPNYQPMPGGWAAVVLEHSEGTQTVFTIVDP